MVPGFTGGSFVTTESDVCISRQEDSFIAAVVAQRLTWSGIGVTEITGFLGLHSPPDLQTPGAQFQVEPPCEHLYANASLDPLANNTRRTNRKILETDNCNVATVATDCSKWEFMA